MTWDLHTKGALGNIWSRDVGGGVEYCVVRLEDFPQVDYCGFAKIEEALLDFVINGFGWKYGT